MTKVYKILSRAEWSEAALAGVFRGSAVDLKDGFIHLSTADQAAETARRHFHGRKGLILLVLDAESLGDALRWEPSRGGALFPHLYGPLYPSQVEADRDLSLNAAGWPDPGSLAP